MFRALLTPLVFFLFLISPKDSETFIPRSADERKLYVSCGPARTLSLDELPRIKHPRLIYPDEKSEFPLAVANNNTVPAGTH